MAKEHEKAAEHEKTEHHERVVKIRLPKINVWMIATVVLLVALVVVYFRGSSVNLGTGLTSQQAADKALSFINKNLVQNGNVSLVSVKDASGLYQVTVLYQGQDVPVFMTKDGTYMFLSQPVNMSAQIPQQTTQQQTQQTMQKTDTPTVELFVMSFCPYGIQAE
jgi:hypothetical protein